jgi:hypothetical protein
MQLQNQLGGSFLPSSLCDERLCFERELTNSNGQSDWSFPKELRDYESHESICETPTTECDDEGNEYGNDEGMFS